MLFFEIIEKPANNPLVKVVTTKEGVAIGGLDFEDTTSNLEDGDIESAAT